MSIVNPNNKCLLKRGEKKWRKEVFIKIPLRFRLENAKGNVKFELISSYLCFRKLILGNATKFRRKNFLIQLPELDKLRLGDNAEKIPRGKHAQSN